MNQKIIKITPEELAKTQVLNLNEVQATAKYEKKTSKRPAILLGIAGIMSITLGLSYTNLIALIDSMPSTVQTEYRVHENNNVVNSPTTSVSCGIADFTNLEGTSSTTTYNFVFDEENKLKAFTNIFSLSQITGSEIGLNNLEKYNTELKSLEGKTIPGYTNTTSYTGTGLTSVTSVDLETFDRNALTEEYQLKEHTKVPYNLGDVRETIIEDLKTKGYTCK